MSWGAHVGPHWRTIGDVFYGENVQRLPLPLIYKESRHQFFTLHACARGKVIGSVIVIVDIKITKSRKIGIGQSALCDQNSQKSQKTITFASNHLGRPMSTTNHMFSLATPIDHTYQCHVLFPLHIRDLKVVKGRRVIKSISMHTRHYTALQLTQGTRLSIPHCYYNSNIAMVCGVCALESSSLIAAVC